MSRAYPAPAQIVELSWLMLLRRARNLAVAAGAVASAVVLRRAASRAHRELAALDDRTLADIGLDRAELMSLLDGSPRNGQRPFCLSSPEIVRAWARDAT
jgi:uncharacterized protein YjiS (DUF1127 family)